MIADSLLVIGAILISIGVGVIYVPAGVISAGIFCVALAFKVEK